jgi:GNAT superfamily N-acetyltransferase
MSEPEIEIRPARPEDTAACAAIYAAALSAVFPEEPATSRDAAAYERACAGEEQWVCWCLGSIIGFISVDWSDNFVHSLYIDPRRWGLGAGRALLGAVQALDRGPLELKVDEVNTAARSFYRHLGWQEVGEGVGHRGRWLRLRWA